MAGLVSQPQFLLIVPSNTLSHVKDTADIISGINLTFFQPCEGKMFTRVSQGTQKDPKCERGRKNDTRQSGKEGN